VLCESGKSLPDASSLSLSLVSALACRIARWHRKTLLSAGKLSLSSRGMRLQALDRAVSAQVGSAMRDPERLIRRARAPRDAVHRDQGRQRRAWPRLPGSRDTVWVWVQWGWEGRGGKEGG